MHQVLLKPFFSPVSCLSVSEVCPEGCDAAEQRGYAVLSPGISISAHPYCCFLVSKGSFGVTAYGWPLPVKENLFGACTNLCAQPYHWSMLCSSVRVFLWISFPIRTDHQSICKARKPLLFPPITTNPAP